MYNASAMRRPPTIRNVIRSTCSFDFIVKGKDGIVKGKDGRDSISRIEFAFPMPHEHSTGPSLMGRHCNVVELR